MAKEENKMGELTLENVEDKIREGGLITEDMASEAVKRIATARKEKVTEELVKEINIANYIQARTFLSVRHSRKNQEIRTSYLKDLTTLNKQLTSGDATLSLKEYKDKVKKSKDDHSKQIVDNDKKLSELENELYNQFPGAHFSWYYEVNLLTPTGK